MNLPGSAKTHLWGGLAVALVGVLVGGYAYTGDRIYRLAFLPLALVGLVLVLGGSALAGYGQANRPRMGGRPSQDEDDGPTFRERVQETFAGLLGDDAEEDDEETADDPAEHDADASSTPATDEQPPETDEAGADEEDQDDQDDSLVEQARVGAASLMAALTPQNEDEQGGREAADATETADPVEEPEPVEADLECPKCRRTFTATGQPPFEAECPNCQYADLVDPS